MKKDIKILFCPAHFRFSDNIGSEYNAAFSIADLLSKRFPKSVVVTGKSDFTEANYRIVESQQNKDENWMKDSTDWSTFRSMIFALSYMWKGFLLLRSEQFDLIHHIRPFAIGQTFNILPFLWSAKKMPFVIGEFSSPYSTRAL